MHRSSSLYPKLPRRDFQREPKCMAYCIGRREKLSHFQGLYFNGTNCVCPGCVNDVAVTSLSYYRNISSELVACDVICCVGRPLAVESILVVQS